MNSRAPLIEEWSNFLRRINIFSELDEEALKEVAKKLQPLSLPKGTTIYRQDDPADALYIIQSGRVKVFVNDEDGKEKVINYLSRGETFGETSLLTGDPHSITTQVDSNAHFLVLYKKDFEAVLVRSPIVMFYLTRLLSRRLMAVGQPLSQQAPPRDMVGLFSDLPNDEHVVFIVNLCLSLAEQTRRRVLLLELGPSAPEIVRSVGLEPVRTSAQMLRSSDLQDPKILQKMALVHPSGFEILSLSEDIFSGNLFHAISGFMSFIGDTYDFVVVDTHGMHGAQGDGVKNQVAREFLGECDSIFHVSEGGAINDEEFLFSIAQQGHKLRKVVVGSKLSPLEANADFYVPWNDGITANYKRAGHPYLTNPLSEPTQRIMDRIARAIGKLQVGFAMGSGAAYGYTIIGILKVFEREKIPIDFIAGTSMGALLGSFFAAGLDAEAVENISNSITKIWLRKNFLSDLNLPWPHGGILQGETIGRFLRTVLKEKDFKEMVTPFACVATDISSGDPVVLKEGKVWQAVRGSLSLPIIFKPQKLGDHLLLDGGLVNPVPTSVIAGMGADILISVNLTTKVSEKKVSLRRFGMFPASSPGIFNILLKMIYTMQYQVVSARSDVSHVMIQPDTRNFSWVDFHKARQIIPLGEEAAEEVLTKVKSRLPFFADYCKVPLRRK